MLFVTPVFLVLFPFSLQFLIFSRVFIRVFHTNMLVSRKTQENYPMRAQRGIYFLYYTTFGENGSWLNFFTCFGTFEVTKTQIRSVI